MLNALFNFLREWVERKQMARKRRRNVFPPPSCFRWGEAPPPGPQEQAENDCVSCPWAYMCLDHRPKVRVS